MNGLRPILIGYDGAEHSELAIREAGELLAPRRALVVVVWEAGLAFDLIELPAVNPGLPPAPVDVRSALEVDQAMYERAQELARKGAGLARDAGFDAEGLAVADEISVAQTLVRLASEREAQAVVVGARGRGALGELVLGSTSRDVVRHAPCPAVVVNAKRERK